MPGKGPFEEMPREQASKAMKEPMRLRKECSSQAKALRWKGFGLLEEQKVSVHIAVSSQATVFGGHLPDPPNPTWH